MTTRSIGPVTASASPGLTAGRGLKPPLLNDTRIPRSRIARPHGRARIETSIPAPRAHGARRIARPHGRARIETTDSSAAMRAGRWASPGLTAGRGLKPADHRRLDSRKSIARPHGRARIETAVRPWREPAPASIARPHGRARIETRLECQNRLCPDASPGLTAGRGLKLGIAQRQVGGHDASPGLTAGRGLKLLLRYPRRAACLHRPASRPGAD